MLYFIEVHLFISYAFLNSQKYAIILLLHLYVIIYDFLKFTSFVLYLMYFFIFFDLMHNLIFHNIINYLAVVFLFVLSHYLNHLSFAQYLI
jgi:hypothetical protein